MLNQEDACATGVVSTQISGNILEGMGLETKVPFLAIASEYILQGTQNDGGI